jgi:hypothetical protein
VALKFTEMALQFGAQRINNHFEYCQSTTHCQHGVHLQVQWGVELPGNLDCLYCCNKHHFSGGTVTELHWLWTNLDFLGEKSSDPGKLSASCFFLLRIPFVFDQ